MARAKSAPEALRRRRRIFLSDEEIEQLRLVYGEKPFSEWARERLLASLQRDIPHEGPVLAPPEAIAPPARESLALPPEGQPDSDGVRYRFEPRNARGDAGTLTLVLPDGRGLEMDLIGVERALRPEGGCELSFGDRTQLREVKGDG